MENMTDGNDKIRECVALMGVFVIPLICIWLGCFPSPREFVALIIGTVIAIALVPNKTTKKSDAEQ